MNHCCPVKFFRFFAPLRYALNDNHFRFFLGGGWRQGRQPPPKLIEIQQTVIQGEAMNLQLLTGPKEKDFGPTLAGIFQLSSFRDGVKKVEKYIHA
jgi:hypothetical protein